MSAVQGLETVLREVVTLPVNIEKKVLRGAAYAGSAVVRNRIKADAPVASSPHYRGRRKVAPGTLKRAVVHKWARELSGPGYQSYVVTVRQGKRWQGNGRQKDSDAYYAWWVERGHRIVPRKGRAGAGIASRRRSAAGFVGAKQFFEPGYRAALGQAEAAMYRRADQLLDEVIR